jgi:hypothetical protein
VVRGGNSVTKISGWTGTEGEGCVSRTSMFVKNGNNSKRASKGIEESRD